MKPDDKNTSAAKRGLSQSAQLNIIAVFMLAWLCFIAWLIAWPLSWLSVPVFLALGYAIFRIVFELTINRKRMPTLATCYSGRHKIADILIREAAANGKAPYNIVDLGSGRGELARLIATKIPKADVLGIEIARVPFCQASLVQRWLGPKNLSYRCEDFWSFDCAAVDAIVLYLAPTVQQRMGEKLRREMKKGSLILVFTFPLGDGWVPVETIHFHSPFRETLYVYRV